jgi:TonB family protein
MNRTLVVHILWMSLLIPLLGEAQSNSLTSVAVRLAAAPVYPPIALTAHASGDVQVALIIGKTGDVTAAAAVSGNPLLHRAAVEAAKRWKFERLDDEARVELTFSFRMVPVDTLAEDMTAVFMPPYHLEVRAKPPAPTVNH